MAEKESALSALWSPCPSRSTTRTACCLNCSMGANLCGAIRSCGNDWNRPEGRHPQPFQASEAATDSPCTTMTGQLVWTLAHQNSREEALR